MDVPGSERVVDDADHQSRAHGDDGGDELAGELLLGRERPYIVDEPRYEDGDEREDEQGIVEVKMRRGLEDRRPEADHPAQVVDKHRAGEAEDDRQAAHARYGLLVDAPLVGIVDGVELDRDLLREGCRDDAAHQGGQEEADV